MTSMNFMSKAVLCAGLVLATQNAVSQIVINEVSTNSDDIEVFGQTCDWIELYNPTPGYVSMSNFAISDNPDKPRKWVFTDNYRIEPYGFLMILCNDEGSGANTNFKLSAEGETIILSNSNGDIVDSVKVPSLYPDQSFGRATDGAHFWGIFTKPSPNESNNSTEALTTPPKMELQSGFYKGGQKLVITCDDPDAEIYYTINGNTPNTKSTLYKGPISFSSTTVFRAIARNPNLERSSTVESKTYFVNFRECKLPVVSLITDPANFYDNTKGIYVAGTNGISGNCSDRPVNWNHDWERPVHFEYFDKDHKQVVSLDAGVKIFGSCSRTNAMKSLRIIARKEQYGEKRIEYKFFANKDIDKFKSIVLRNGGNDFQTTMIRDGLITQLCSKHMDVDIQEFQPAAVFLNGEYLGLHNIREKISDHYIEENYGIKNESVTLLENNSLVIEGSNEEYNNFLNYATSNNLADDYTFNRIKTLIDLDNFTDYYIAQLYVDNEDWPNNNIKYWKSSAKNSRWRWILFGTEYSCGVYGRGPDNNSIKRVFIDHDNELGNSSWSTKLIKSMMKNENYKQMFLQRFAYHIDNTFSSENVRSLADSLRNLMYDEWKYHSDKYYTWIGQSAWWNNINSLINWFERRPRYIREHLQKVFELDGTVNITVKCSNQNAKILLDGYLPKTNISGVYFKGLKMHLTPQLPDNLEFDHWEVVENAGTENATAQQLNTQELTIDPQSDLEITLVVKSRESMEFCELGHYNGAEFVELFNNSLYDFDLSGYTISGNITHQFAAGTIVPSKGYVTISDQMLKTSINQQFTEGGIGTSGSLVLKNSKGGTADIIEYTLGENNWPEMPENSSIYLNRHGDDNNVSGNWQSAPVSTPGQQSRFVAIEGLKINEICAKNGGTLADENNNYSSWFELVNASMSTINIAGLYIGDGKNYYTVPYDDLKATTLATSQRVIFFADGDPSAGMFHTNFKLNGDGGKIEIIQVVNGEAKYVDQAEYPKISKGQSYGLSPDITGTTYATFVKPTPESANKGEIVQIPALYVPQAKVDTPVETVTKSTVTFTIYPNPAKNSFTIRCGNQNPQWEISDLLGSTVKSGKGTEVDVTNLTSGYYIIRIVDGATTAFTKFMKL